MEPNFSSNAIMSLGFQTKYGVRTTLLIPMNVNNYDQIQDLLSDMGSILAEQKVLAKQKAAEEEAKKAEEEKVDAPEEAEVKEEVLEESEEPVEEVTAE